MPKGVPGEIPGGWEQSIYINAFFVHGHLDRKFAIKWMTQKGWIRIHQEAAIPTQCVLCAGFILNIKRSLYSQGQPGSSQSCMAVESFTSGAIKASISPETLRWSKEATILPLLFPPRTPVPVAAVLTGGAPESFRVICVISSVSSVRVPLFPPRDNWDIQESLLSGIWYFFFSLRENYSFHQYVR